jgi:hypothetical protein
MDLKPKISSSFRGILSKLNIGGSRASNSGKSSDRNSYDDDDDESDAEGRPSFVKTVFGFAKTVYMKSAGITNEDSLLVAHERWKEGFILFLDSKALANASGDYTFKDSCEVCQWLSDKGRVRWSKNPVFATLVERHKYFHEQADLVLSHAKSGDQEKAQRTLDTNYKYGSGQTVLLLKKLKTLQKAQESMY